MEVRKLKAFSKTTEFCHNGCRTTLGPQGETAIRAASHVVTILGYDTLLCSECARGWRRVWDEALGVAA